MSFKREGNDMNLLDVLKKRRIKDLLSDDIPEDEAKLLCNGRFICTVCLNHPILDNVSMLTVHRHGKKHKYYQEIHDYKKKELKCLIRKRQHEDIIKHGTTSINMGAILGKGSISSSPYNPCVKKPRTGQKERKPRLDLTITGEANQIRAGTSSKDSTSYWRETYQQQMNEPIVHERQLKNIFNERKSCPGSVPITPYQSKARSRPFPPELEPSRVLCEPDPLSNGTSTQHIRQAKRLPCQISKSEVNESQTVVGSANMSDIFICTPKSTTSRKFKSLKRDKVSSKSRPSLSHLKVSSPIHSSDSIGHKNSEGNEDPLAEKYHLLQGSGWKKDWDGKWIKDESAEFDSDEEPPDLP